MSSPVERITEVLEQHQRFDGWDEANRYHFYCEACIEPSPKIFKTLGAFNAHVVALVLAALELTEEWATDDRDYMFRPCRDRKTAETRAERINRVYAEEHAGVAGASMMAPDAKVVHRWVSPWVGLHP